MRNDLRPLLVVALLVGGAAIAGCGGGGTGVNVILISIDTLRADHTSLYDSGRHTTPNIERLGGRGVIFENAYAQAPNTAPSHTTMLSGVYPSAHLVWSHGMMPNPSLPTLPKLFQEAGYRTAAWVQLEGMTYNAGFDEYHYMAKRWSYIPERPAEVVQWLRDNRDQPFFMFLHTYEPHAPYHPPEQYRAKYDTGYDGQLRNDIIKIDELALMNSGEMPSTQAELDHVMAMYDAEIEFIDQRLSVVFDAIEELGLSDNTVVALVSDHGEEFGERGQIGRHSYTIFNELMHIPMVFVGPGIPEGMRIETQVGNVDLAPTLLGLAGIEVPRVYQGIDLASLWNGESDEVRPVVVERPDEQAIIAGNWKFFSGGQLYDLATDPGETVDVSEANPTQTAFLRDQLDRWLAETQRVQDVVGPVGGERLTRQERNRLRDLGYIQ